MDRALSGQRPVLDDGDRLLRVAAGGDQRAGDARQLAHAHVEDQRPREGGQRRPVDRRVRALAASSRVWPVTSATAPARPAVGDGDPRVGGGGHSGRDAGDDLERDPRRPQRERLLAAAAEDERVAALQPHDGPPGAGVLEHQLLGPLLRDGLAAALLADEQQLGVRPRALERAGADEPVIEDHVGAGDQLERPGRQQAGVARPGADEVHAARSAAAHGRTAAAPPPPGRSQQLLGAGRAQPLGHRPAERLGVAQLADELVGRPGGAVGQADPGAQRQPPAGRASGVGAERRVAVGARARGQGTLGQQARQRRPVGDRATAARDAARPRRGPPARARPGRAPARSAPGRACHRPRPRGPSRSRPARASTIASQALPPVGELREARVHVAPERNDVEILAGGPQLRERAAGCSCRRGRRGPAPSSAALPQSTSSARGAGGGAEQRGALGEARRGRPWPSAPRGRSAVEQRLLELGHPARLVARRPGAGSPPVTIGTISRLAGIVRATSSACASARALRRVPIRISAGCASGAPCGGAQVVDLRQLLERAASARRRPRAGRTARGRARGWRGRGRRSRLRRRIVGSCSRRVITARAIASTRAMSRADADSQRPEFSARTCSTIALPCSRSAPTVGSASSWPSQRAKRWISSSTISSARGASSARVLRLRATTACRSSMS